MSNTPAQQAPKAPTAADENSSGTAAADAANKPSAPEAEAEAPKARKRPSQDLVIGKKYTFDSLVGRLQDPTTGEWFGEDGPKRTTHTAWIAMQMDADAARLTVVIEE